MGLAGTGLITVFFNAFLSSAKAAGITGFPAMRNPAFTLDRPITIEEEATTYTNFYEFGSSKNIWRKARIVTDPWIFAVDGLVNNPLQMDASELIARTGPQEERLYRHRCVEAWAMACSLDRRANVASGNAGPAKSGSEIYPAGNFS